MSNSPNTQPPNPQSSNTQPPHTQTSNTQPPNPQSSNTQLPHTQTSNTQPSNTQFPSTQPDTEQLKILREIKGIVANDSFISWFSRNVVLGNLLLTTLATYTGFNIFESIQQKAAGDELLSKVELCSEQLQTSNIEVLSSANPANTDVSVLPVKQGLSATNLMFGCRYESDEKGRLLDAFLQVQAIPENLILTQNKEFIERPISKEDLNAVCRNERFFLPELEKKGRNQSEYRITPRGAVLDIEANNVYPVFRWKCEYDIKPKNNSGQDEIISTGSSESTGIDLDKNHCREIYGEEGLIKASYHDYNDPYSWHCTNPNASR